MGQVNMLGVATKLVNARPVLASILGKGGNYDHFVLAMDANVTSSISGVFPVPPDFTGAPRFLLRWGSAGTTGNARFIADYRCVGGDNVEALDQAGFDEQVTTSQAVAGTTWRRRELAFTLSTSPVKFAAGDTVQFTLTGDRANGADTLESTLGIVELLFDYT